MKKLKYVVMVDDNFHFTDKSERYASGTFSTYDEAVTKSKEIINEFLESAITAIDTSESLYTCWLMYGENPFIIGGSENWFNVKDYLRERIEESIKMSGI